jgi:hypothetical protein
MILGFNDFINEETQENRNYRWAGIKKDRADQFMRQAMSNNRDSRYLAAKSKYCNEEGLRILMNDRDPSIRRRVALNPYTPASILKDMLHDEKLHLLIASNPNASPEILRELSSSTDDQVISKIAGNRNAPIDLLLKLENYPDGVTRGNAKRNKTHIAWRAAQ